LISLERVKGIEPLYSAWKSSNFLVLSTHILTIHSIFAGQQIGGKQSIWRALRWRRIVLSAAR
jgi:hypothetical protein